jgi:diguanylate cyclase (GGDEF)-like protein
VAFDRILAGYSGDSSGSRAMMLIADLDEFKAVNDALGHEVGDQLLIAVAGRLADLPLSGGTVARLGGDEFAVMTLARGPAEARDLADTVVEALSEPVSLDGLRIDIAASIGTALHCDDEDFAALMRHADIAMYDAKDTGGTVATYRPGTHQDSLQRLALLTDLRHALQDRDNTQITLHYQPQIRLSTGDVEGVEALLRWQHPVKGPIGTQQLVSMTEHSAVMHLLTAHVIDTVIAQAGIWCAQDVHLRVSINVSARDLYGDDIVERLAQRMAQHGVSPSQIQIEITEGALMADPNRATGTVNRIRALGVAVSLDDFGTGYSSLAHLRRMPISEIKIDRSFVAGMAGNRDDAAIVTSTVELARSLGIRTVAEGVENMDTRRLLADVGCTLMQGWLTGRPMPAVDIRPWLIAQHSAYEPI